MILGSTCACSGADDCSSVLQQVADVCPLSEGHTLFTSSGYSASGCQLVSVRVHTCTHTQVHTLIHMHTVWWASAGIWY